MDERINILRKYNLWGDTAFDFGFRRSEYNEKIMDFTGNRLVKILTGQRRAGKSYLLRQTARQLIENGVPAANTLFINREMTDLDFIKTYKDLDEIIKLYQAIIQPTGKVYIFIDEIQLIKDWEKTINSYSQDYTAEYELFISGSNSKLLSGELATLLSGRYVCFNVFLSRINWKSDKTICLLLRTPFCCVTLSNVTIYVTPNYWKIFLSF